VFDARKKDAIDTLRQLAPDGLDAVLACAGGEALDRCLRSVRAGGRIAFPNGIEPEPRAGKKVRVMSYDAQAGREQFARLERAVNEAKLQVPIAGVYPLPQAAKAHRQIEKGRVVGRIVLRTRAGPS
jgi:NADPH2:quinone reductase